MPRASHSLVCDSGNSSMQEKATACMYETGNATGTMAGKIRVASGACEHARRNRGRRAIPCIVHKGKFLWQCVVFGLGPSVSVRNSVYNFKRIAAVLLILLAAPVCV